MGQENSTTTGTQMSSSSDFSEGAIVSKGRATREPMDTPQRPLEVNPNDEKSEQSTPASTPESSSSDEAKPLFFILEEIQSTSSTPKISRPATIRAAFLDKATAHTAMELLVYECRDPPAARRVICHEIFRDEQFLGEGYEYHTRSLLWRTLWIQEGFEEEDLQIVEEEDEVEAGVGGEDGGEEEGTPSVRVQGSGTRLSGGGRSLPSMFGD